MLSSSTQITTTEMHTGGEPLRIVETGYPDIQGSTILEKRRFAREHLDAYRKLIMHEPRGHYDMYGALKVAPSAGVAADLAVLFIHNEGYSTMCGHAVVALGRYALDTGLVAPSAPETQVRIECPCGLVTAWTEYDDVTKRSGRTRFHSVPAFAFKTDVSVEVGGHGRVTVDVGYGGAFYALVDGAQLGLDVTASSTRQVVDAATAVTEAVRAAVPLHHPDNADLAFHYGTIVTDGRDGGEGGQDGRAPESANICVFADREVDRSPCGSGVTARMAMRYAKALIGQNESCDFTSGATGSQFTAKVVKETKCGEYPAVVVEVAGNAYYSGSSTFTVEEEDELKNAFLLK